MEFIYTIEIKKSNNPKFLNKTRYDNSTCLITKDIPKSKPTLERNPKRGKNRMGQKLLAKGKPSTVTKCVQGNRKKPKLD